MIRVSKEQTRRILDLHSWSGILLGLALYVVILTGAIVVFISEIGTWSVSGSPVEHPISHAIDERLKTLAEEVPQEYWEEVTVFHNFIGQQVIFFHTHEKDSSGNLEEVGVRFLLDSETGEVLKRYEGFREEMPEDPTSALSSFLVEMHVNLHAPSPWGLYLTGILGLVLLISAITGFILHRNLIRDIFLSPRSLGNVQNARDRHNLAATWGLPFSILLAFTGAFFSFAISLGLPVIAFTAFGGDQEKAIEAIIGAPEVLDERPAPMANLDTMIERSARMEGNMPVFMAVHNWGTVDSRVTVFHRPVDGEIAATQHEFVGTSGSHLGVKPGIGTQPSAGDTMVNVIRVLHFGNFAGWLSRTIWFALGLAMCYVTLTGMQLWVARREHEPQGLFMAKALSFVAYGLPLTLVTATMAFLFSHAIGLSSSWTVWGFLLGTVVAFVMAWKAVCAKALTSDLQYWLGLSLMVLPFLRGLLSGTHWIELLDGGNSAVLILDVFFLLCGLAFLVTSGKTRSVVSIDENSVIERNSQTVDAPILASQADAQATAK